MSRLPRRNVLVALIAAFVWTLTLRPIGALVRPLAQDVAAPVHIQAPAAAHAGLLRLHLLANSDRGPDQAAKLAVRAAILPILERTVGRARTEATAEAAARLGAPALAAAATRTLHDLGRAYAARVVVGDAYFPAKRQGGLYLGAGVYPTVTVILGRGQGQNWWCLLFPDMCLANPLDSVSRSEPASAPEVLRGPIGRDGGAPGAVQRLVHDLLSWL